MRKVTETADGSRTLYVPELDEHYHSVHGAVRESLHVFIEHGIKHVSGKDLHILEIGFGTGLNALLTFDSESRTDRFIRYTGIDKYPVSLEEAMFMNYPETGDNERLNTAFLKFHSPVYDTDIYVSERFVLRKKQCDFYEIGFKDVFDLIYFDAFGPRVQPDLWEKRMFDNMFQILKPGGVLVTYCAKGQVRRDMQSAGFEVERLPGPPGKREMLRATK